MNEIHLHRKYYSQLIESYNGLLSRVFANEFYPFFLTRPRKIFQHYLEKKITLKG